MQHLTYSGNLICYGTHCETKDSVVSFVWLGAFAILFILPILYYALI